MKKMMLTMMMVCATIATLNAQSFYAVKGGLTNGSQKVNTGFGNVSASELGFHIGLAASFELTETIALQPEVLFTSVNDASLLQIPVYGSYAVGDSGFKIQAGPQFNLLLEETPDDFSSFSVALTLGGAYDINENFFVDLHYAFQLTNSYTGDGLNDGEFGFDGDFSSRSSFLNAGVGYKF